jgi:hypothetical protein
MNSYWLGAAALAVSVPFGFLSAELLRPWLAAQAPIAGLVLASSLFTYTILLVQLMRRQPPRFLRTLFPRKNFYTPRSINEMSGLRLDYIGAKDPEDRVDGIVHNRAEELQRIVHCQLPPSFSFSGQPQVLETLFADLALVDNARFQVIFPEAESGFRKEMIVVASYQLAKTGRQAKSGEAPPLVQLQNVLDRLLERLITLGITPKVMNSVEVRQLISAELGSRAKRWQLDRDWRNIGNLGWEPSFRDIPLKPNERFMQVAERHSCTIAVEQLPASGNFEWLSAVLNDVPTAHLSVFSSSWDAADPLSKIRLNKRLEQLKTIDAASLEPYAAQMSFYIRFDARNLFNLDIDVNMARKYFASLGINKGNSPTYRLQQLQNWRASLPCAQEQAQHRHLLAFTRGAVGSSIASGTKNLSD